MVVTDPIADMLTRIRNAQTAQHETVAIPFSKEKKAITNILADEGFIKSYEVVEKTPQNDIVVTLKYIGKKNAVITGLKRVSTPGLRVYAGVDKLPKVLNGMGIAILSTSKGIMTDKAARNAHIGGEVLAYVW